MPRGGASWSLQVPTWRRNRSHELACKRWVPPSPGISHQEKQGQRASLAILAHLDRTSSRRCEGTPTRSCGERQDGNQPPTAGGEGGSAHPPSLGPSILGSVIEASSFMSPCLQANPAPGTRPVLGVNLGLGKRHTSRCASDTPFQVLGEWATPHSGVSGTFLNCSSDLERLEGNELSMG